MAKSTNPIVKFIVLGVVCFAGYHIFIADKPADSPKNTAKSTNKSSGSNNVEKPVADIETQEALIVMAEQMNTSQNKMQANIQEFEAKIESMTSQASERMLDEEKKNEIIAQQSKLLQELAQKVKSLSENKQSSVTNSTETVGDGSLDKFDLDFEDANAASDPLAVPRKVDRDGFVIIEPIDYTSAEAVYDDEGDSSGGLLGGVSSVFDNVKNSTAVRTSGRLIDNATEGTVLETELSQPEVIPFLTIPQSTEIFGGLAANAILGRVPRGGGVVEPYDFKITLSGDNLSSNGFKVPYLRETIWRGTAVGDPSLSCVRGNIYAVTFIFEDGSIGYVHDGNNKEFKSNDVIATIRDERGNCLSGEVHGNEGSYITAQALAQSVEVAGQGIAKSQYDSVNGGNGINESFTGEMSKMVGGSFAEGIGSGLKDAISERYANVYNVIAVPPGTKVNIDVKKQIAIDYKLNSRKVSYEEVYNTNNYSTLD